MLAAVDASLPQTPLGRRVSLSPSCGGGVGEQRSQHQNSEDQQECRLRMILKLAPGTPATRQLLHLDDLDLGLLLGQRWISTSLSHATRRVASAKAASEEAKDLTEK